MATQLGALMFLDLHGWSRARDEDWLAYVQRYLPEIRELLRNHRATSYNTWGDSVFSIFSSCIDAANCALAIRDFFRKDSPGTDRALLPRIALHTGELHCLQNPLLEREDYFGSAVHTAARIEPVVDPGFVWCTVEFKANCEMAPSLSPRFHALGSRALAKGFGSQELFVVLWRNEPHTGPPPAVRPALPAPRLAPRSTLFSIAPRSTPKTGHRSTPQNRP